MKNILVTGAGGQLGLSLKQIKGSYPQFNFLFADKKDLDITYENSIDRFFNQNNLDLVVNCAAYTAVDLAESNPEQAYLVNATATKNLAQATAKHNIPLIHISTDYVFDGNISKPRLETDPVNPINIYGQTKLLGEQLALAANPQTVVIRTSWVYSVHQNNFVKTMCKLFSDKSEINVINDQIGSPTHALDLAHAILQIANSSNKAFGIFNYSNEGQCSWYEFALKIKEITNATININPIPSSAYPTTAKRPAFSLLDKTKIKNTYKIEVPNWQSSLENMLHMYLK